VVAVYKNPPASKRQDLMDHEELIYTRKGFMNIRYIPFCNKIWFHQLIVLGPPAAVLLVEGEVKELVQYLPVNGGLECPTNWSTLNLYTEYLKTDSCHYQAGF